MILKRGKGNSLNFGDFQLDRFGVRKRRAKGQNRKKVPALNIPESDPMNVKRGDGIRVKSDGEVD